MEAQSVNSSEGGSNAGNLNAKALLAKPPYDIRATPVGVEFLVCSEENIQVIITDIGEVVMHILSPHVFPQCIPMNSHCLGSTGNCVTLVSCKCLPEDMQVYYFTRSSPVSCSNSLNRLYLVNISALSEK